MEKCCSIRSWFSVALSYAVCSWGWAADLNPNDRDVPCTATYDLILDSKQVGSINSRLENLHSNHWRYEVDTTARRGIIKATIKQFSEYDIRSGQIRPLIFSSRQKIAISKRDSTAQYDWDSMTASGTHKKNDWTVAMESEFVDRLTINQQLKMDLRNKPGQRRFQYTRLDRGKKRPMTFVRRQSKVPVDVPLGQFETELLEREHNSKDRRTASWHAPELRYLPVRMELLDDGELTVTQLRSIDGCRASQATR